MKRCFILVSCACLAACVQQSANVSPVSKNKKPMSLSTGGAEDNCKIYGSDKWHAWIDRGGEGGGLRLQISGEVTLPSRAYICSKVTHAMACPSLDFGRPS